MAGEQIKISIKKEELADDLGSTGVEPEGCRRSEQMRQRVATRRELFNAE